MSTPLTVADYLKYADLQMAAEAFLRDPNSQHLVANATELKAALIDGNKHASVFTGIQATAFAAQWEVLDQRANTSTGFSGTLFKNKATGELVISFRSTEFIDDAARDNQATNVLEIADHGFAFGQLRDMEAWYQELKTGPNAALLANSQLAVTGYSLGGHLATAFNMLHGKETLSNGVPRVKEVVTFNAAGVGLIDTLTNLQALLTQFTTLAANGQAITFSDAGLATLYQRVRQAIDAGGTISAQDSAALTAFMQPGEAGPSHPQIVKEATMIWDAVSRVAVIRAEIERLKGLTGSDGTKPKDVTKEETGQDSLDYQMAVLTVGQFTENAGYFLGALRTVGNKVPAGHFANQFDVVGAGKPSLVANSQWHYGTDVPIYIEDQPIFRGGGIDSTIAESFKYGGAKLLVNGYGKKDFGDTHSLVLLVDSLNVQNALLRLIPAAQRSTATNTLQTILQNASYLKSEEGDFVFGDKQGKAEGDVLENVLNALGDLALGPAHTKLKPVLSGGTWADIGSTSGQDGRDALYAKLAAIVGSEFYKRAIAGEFTVTLAAAASNLSSQARKDFGAYAALASLSPFALAITGSATSLQAAFSIWGSTYTDWLADKTAIANGTPTAHLKISEDWLSDRAQFLDRKNWFNAQNVNPLNPNPIGEDITHPHPYLKDDSYFIDAASGYTIAQGFNPNSPPQALRHFYFGDGKANAHTGGAVSDHLYGGGGMDTLSGLAGSDILEGGADSDVLNGGAGSDILNGGQGADAYVFNNASGFDTITDSDGQGVIQIEGIAITGSGARKLAEGVWQSADKTTYFSLVPQAGGSNDLYLSFADRADVIRIRNWSDTSKVGITLPTTLAPPGTTSTLNGDFAKQNNGTTYSTDADGNYLSAGAQVGAADVLNGNTTAQTLLGQAGNDGIAGGGGADSIDGGLGSDLLLGGSGADRISGGAGADIIFGSGAGQIDHPGTVAFTPPPLAAGAEQVARGFSWVAQRSNQPRLVNGKANMRYIAVAGAYAGATISGPDGNYVEADGNTIDGGAGDDYIAAGTGADLVHGGDDNDDIVGMADNDVLFGDAGDDLIWGDGTTSANPAYTDPNEAGDDQLFGGDGNDALVGQGGQDLLDGGIGNDMLFGDGGEDPAAVADTPWATHDDDYLDGGEGNDTLVGEGGGDILHGGLGDDILRGDSNAAAALPGQYQGQDDLDGGDGADQLTGGGNDDWLQGGAGNDLMWGDEQLLINGYDAATPQNAQGADEMDGGDGDDQLTGGGAADRLYGGAGNDILWGDYTSGYLSAADGADWIAAGEGDDQMAGGGGDDTLMGDAGHDLLQGDNGNDTLDGGDGDDALFGGAGNDTLSGGGGVDNFAGGAGDDTYVLHVGEGALGAGSVAEGVVDSEGRNTIVLQGADPTRLLVQANANGDLIVAYSFALNAAANTYETVDALVVSQGARYSNNTYVIGGNSDGVSGPRLSLSGMIGRYSPTMLTGTDEQGRQMQLGGTATELIQTNVRGALISGGRGDDVLLGSGGGNHTYFYSLGDGSDTLTDTSAKIDANGNPTPNRIVFGDGIAPTDVKALFGSFGYTTGLRLYVGGNSQDSITLPGTTTAGEPVIDRFEFADGSVLTYAQLIARGFDGTAGADSMQGMLGNDRINGGAGDDVLSGNYGNDTLTGGAGNDTLQGGPGDDIYTFGRGAGRDSIIETAYNGSTDTLLIDAGVSPADLALNVSGTNLLVKISGTTDQVLIENHFNGQSIESIRFADGTVWAQADFAQHIVNALTPESDSYTGTVGADSLNALAGDDTVYALDGHDTLDGGAGNDLLMGDAGDDMIDGGAGGDALKGGAGNDIYIFGNGSGHDLITDANGLNVLRFGPGVNPADVHVIDNNVPPSYSYIVSLNDGADTLTFATASNSADGYGNSMGALARMEFADGTVWLRDDWQRRILEGAATEGNDTISAYQSADIVNALGGHDYVAGQGGNDTLDGSTGVDTLFGGDGNDTLIDGEFLHGGMGDDTYLVSHWSSEIVVAPNAADNAGIDTLVLQLANAADVRLMRGLNPVTNDYDDLWIRPTAPGSGQIVVSQFFSSQAAEREIEFVRFADGTVWSATDIRSRVENRVGTGAPETLIGFRWDDAINGGAGNDTLVALGGNDTLDGGTGNDLLQGGAGADTYLFGTTSGSDLITESFAATAETDTIALGSGIAPANVTLQRDGTSLVLIINGSSTQLRVAGQFNAGSSDGRIERVNFQDGTVWDAAQIAARAPVTTANTFNGTTANDSYTVDDPQDVIVEAANGGADGVSSSISYMLPDNVENLTLTGVLNATANGNALNNALTGNAGNNAFNDPGQWWLSDAGLTGGADTLAGGAGDDLYYVNGPGVTSAYYASLPDDTVIEAANAGNDTVVGNTFNHDLAANVEVLLDRYTSGTWRTTTLGGVQTIEGRSLNGNAQNNVIAVQGGQSAPSILSVGGGIILVGTGDDEFNKINIGSVIRIDGGAGADTMIGSSDDTTYVVDNALDVVQEMGSSSYDTVESSVTYTLGANVEALTLTGSAAVNGSGNAMNNRLDGSANTAANVLTGGLGDDTYVLGAGDSFIEAANGGFDTIVLKQGTAGATYRLSDYANIEGLTVDFSIPYNGAAGGPTLLGTAGNDQLANLAFEGYNSQTGQGARGGLVSGGAGNDTLGGGFGNDTLDGGSGADLMQGGVGNDVYRVDKALDQVIELAYGAVNGSDRQFDTIETTVDYTRPDNVEALVSIGSTGLRLSGGGFLDGSRNTGRDTLLGSAGNDAYNVDGSDVVIEAADGGQDNASGSVSFALADNVEDGTLLGNAHIDLTGNSSDNVLWGNTGNNRFNGDAGNDVLHAFEGNDSLDGGAGNDTLWAHEGDDNIVGGQGDDLMDGAEGADVLNGGSGDDTYRFWRGAGQDRIDTTDVTSAIDTLAFDDSSILESDITAERVGQDLIVKIRGGSDQITLVGHYTTSVVNGQTYDGKLDAIQFASNGAVWNAARLEAAIVVNHAPVVSAPLPDQTTAQGAAYNYTVPTNAFTDPDSGNTLTYSATLADGSPLPLWLSFNASTRAFSGTPTATGSVSVKVTARDGGNLSVSDTFNLVVSIQNLTLTGTASADTLNGGAGNDSLTGLGGNDTLNGAAGADTMKGGTGNDTYTVDNTSDVVTENASEGTDLVQSSIGYTLGTNVENLTLTGSSTINATGNTLANILRGNSAANTLNGGTGADTMIGGAGNDTYIVDASTDVVTELANEGTDLVQSSVTYTLATNVENLTLNGSNAINATGNTLDNVLTGNSGANRLTGNAGNDTLDGGAGNDTMLGGTGNDTFVVNVATDVVTESANEGTDTVRSAVAWTLSANLENLTLTGSNAINGTGNASANVLMGNSGANSLSGLGGNDTLDGGAGVDTLIGGVGNDTYVMAPGYGADLIQENDSTSANTDVVQFLSGISTDQLWFRKVSNNLEVSIIGTSDNATLQNWYLGNQYHAEQFKTSDGKTLLDSKVQNLVNAMAAFSPPGAGQTTLPTNYQTSLAPVIAANWA